MGTSIVQIGMQYGARKVDKVKLVHFYSMHRLCAYVHIKYGRRYFTTIQEFDQPL